MHEQRNGAQLQLRTPVKPFYFNTSAHLLRITRQKANTLAEFCGRTTRCPDGSIFQHSFRTLQEHHFIREGFSNDFAHWALSACNEPSLAEGLASVDVREFTSVAELRERFVQIVDNFLQRELGGGNAIGTRDLLFLRLRYRRDSYQLRRPDAARVRARACVV